MVAHERSGAALCKSKAGGKSVAWTENYRQGICDPRKPQHHSSDLKLPSCERARIGQLSEGSPKSVDGGRDLHSAFNARSITTPRTRLAKKVASRRIKTSNTSKIS